MSTKIKVSLSVTTSPFKSPDGMLNYDEVKKLQDKVTKYLKTVEGQALKPTGYYVISPKAKPVKYSVPSDKKGDLAYLAKRATKVATRKSIRDPSKVVVLLTVLDQKLAPAALKGPLKLAESAITAHVKKIESVKEKISKQKAKIRDVANAAFDKSVGALKEVLLDGGIAEKDIVESTGMFGKTVLVKLGPDMVVSIGKSDASKFNAAKKALTAAK